MSVFLMNICLFEKGKEPLRCSLMYQVILANEEGKVEAARAVDETNELNNVQITDNIVLRKLLVSSNISVEIPF